MSDEERIPIISLKQPWASWVALGWKTIETRTHNRFKSLVNKRIGIHASLSIDYDAIELAKPYLTVDQIERTRGWLKIGGALICTAFVRQYRELSIIDSHRALIDCHWTKGRYGLFLEDLKVIEAIPAKGHLGIWYLDPAEETNERR